MIVIDERNVEHALFSALILFRDKGEEFPSRNGPMIELPEPVTTVYRNPRERVVFDPARDCNPFLHFFESLWMLSGSDDLKFMQHFTGNLDQFSDDGRTLNGAYGYRWRNWFGYDQIDEAIEILKKDPMSRRVVVSMWDGTRDLQNQSSKDLPCNTQVVFRLRNGVLDMTVYNRSNDAVWGAYGANAVHFSFLQEYVACSIGATVGAYRQVSNSLHIYPDLPVVKRLQFFVGASAVNHYGYRDEETPLLLQEGEEQWQLDIDLERMFSDPTCLNWDPQTAFYRTVARPMALLWFRRKEAPVEELREIASGIQSWDWRENAIAWIDRRRKVNGKPLLWEPK